MNYSDQKTNQSLARLENKIKKEYQKALDMMIVRSDNYLDGYDELVNGKMIHHQGVAERIAEQEKAYKAGKYTDQEWKDYVLTQYARGDRFSAMVDDMAKRLSETNQMASSYINDKTPSIYSLNANYQAYEIGKELEGVSFTMYDEQTVKNMITGNGNYTEFRTVKVDPVRDYSWNTQQINSAVTSAILQGKSVDDLADAFLGVMKRNRNSALRNARTAYTSAQNGGRIEGLRQAKAQGINVKKQWLSAHDGRVRDSHATLNGQIRDIDEEFDNGLMFPADSSGAPQEVYNCRCTLTYIYPKYDTDESSEIYRDKALAGETYPEFVKRMSAEDQITIQSNKMRYNDGVDTSIKKASSANTIKKAKAPDLTKVTDETKYVLGEIKKAKIGYNEALKYNESRSVDKIISMLAGDDKTKGSCASVGMAYVGQRKGFDVLDFRGRSSRKYFSNRLNLEETWDALTDGKIITERATSQLEACLNLIDKMKAGKEYYFVGGRHASMLKKTKDDELMYLELQTDDKFYGWHVIDENIIPKNNLENRYCKCSNETFFKRRFGASDASYRSSAFMVDLDDVNSDNLKEVLGYINTNMGKEQKGHGGSIK